MSEQILKQVSLFFFFTLLDEEIALRASRKAAIELSRGDSENIKESKLVYVTRKVWEKYHKQMTRGRYRISGSRGWIPAEGIDMMIWKEFQKSAEEDELLVVIWSHLLKISEEDISLGLGVTKGTVRYRASRGLRRIGDLSLGEADVARL